jgi:hypothetical protein
VTAKTERAAIVRLIDTFGADILVNLTPPPERARGHRARLRMMATAEVDGCQACGLCDHRRPADEIGPRWPESLTTAVELIVLTEFPCDKHHRKLIRAALSQSEAVDPDKVAWVSVVGCRPYTVEGKLRRPSAKEREACEYNLMESLDAASCPQVLLVGAGAVSAWRKDVRITQMSDKVGIWRDRWVVGAVESPDVVNRQEGATLREWMQSVGRVVEMILGDMAAGLGDRCMDKRCTEAVDAWDSDGLPWCKRHLEIKNRKRPREFVDVRLPWGEGEAS